MTLRSINQSINQCIINNIKAFEGLWIYDKLRLKTNQYEIWKFHNVFQTKLKKYVYIIYEKNWKF